MTEKLLKIEAESREFEKKNWHQKNKIMHLSENEVGTVTSAKSLDSFTSGGGAQYFWFIR